MRGHGCACSPTCSSLSKVRVDCHLKPHLSALFSATADSLAVRFALRHCELTDSPHFTSFACRGEPTYVLSRSCSAEYYGSAGPCCKVDDLLRYLTLDRAELFAHTKFALHCDDGVCPP